MQEVLVDRSQLILQLLIEVFEGFDIALHVSSLCGRFSFSNITAQV
jgi:hypothetical protein